jgi:hypothetical protein
VGKERKYDEVNGSLRRHHREIAEEHRASTDFLEKAKLIRIRNVKDESEAGLYDKNEERHEHRCRS